MTSLSLKTVAGLCAAASAVVIACAGMAAMAQDGPPGLGGRGGPPVFHGGRGGGPGQRGQRLHDALQITPAQEQSFQTWQAAMAPSGPPRGADRSLTVPQRLDQALADQTRRDAELRARVVATKAFYNGLTPAQQKTMDSLPLALEAGRGGFGGGGRRGHGGLGAQDFGGPPPR